MNDKLLTTQEVSDYFGVNKNVITQKFCKNGLKFIKLSKTDFRFNMKDVLEYEESLKVQILPQQNTYDFSTSINRSTRNDKNRCTLRV